MKKWFKWVELAFYGNWKCVSTFKCKPVWLKDIQILDSIQLLDLCDVVFRLHPKWLTLFPSLSIFCSMTRTKKVQTAVWATSCSGIPSLPPAPLPAFLLPAWLHACLSPTRLSLARLPACLSPARPPSFNLHFVRSLLCLLSFSFSCCLKANTKYQTGLTIRTNIIVLRKPAHLFSFTVPEVVD